MKFVVFLDALDQNDLTDWMKEQCVRPYTANEPPVTPNIISQIMTGKRREDLPFMRPTKYKKPKSLDIEGKTLFHELTDRGLKVFQYGIPLCSNITLPEGSFSCFDHFQGQQGVPAPLLHLQDNMNMLEDDPELVFHGMVDKAIRTFADMRTLARNDQFDVIFLGFTGVDAYTHCWNPENKARLIEVLEYELKDLQRYGELLIFSDHGNTAMTDVFFPNQWLHEKGWLEYKVYYDLYEFHVDEKIKEKTQMHFEAPFVMIDWDKTKFYTTDAFESMIDATENATDEDVKELIEQLMETGYFDKVSDRNEILDKDGECFEDCPRIIPSPKEGIVTSCNIHKDGPDNKEKGFEFVRKGWHSPRGVVWSTEEIAKETINEPREIYDVILDFLKDVEPKPEKEEENEEQIAMNQLANLGYI